MCAGTIYWAGIGGLVYGGDEVWLRELTGDHPGGSSGAHPGVFYMLLFRDACRSAPENPTLALPCRAVLESGARPTTVIGPVQELAEEVIAPHREFWCVAHHASPCVGVARRTTNGYGPALLYYVGRANLPRDRLDAPKSKHSI